MKYLVLLLPLLSGCASIFPGASTYEMFTIRIDDKVQYEKDLAECHSKIDNYQQPFQTGSVIASTATGATENSAFALSAPAGIVPALGAVGGAMTSLINNASGQTTIKMLVRCVVRETLIDHSAVVVDPNE